MTIGAATYSQLRIGVLMGGKGIEREVSFNSGRTICDHLDTQRFEAIPLFQHYTGQLYILPWRFVRRGKIADFVDRLDTQAQKISWDELKTIVDFVYIATHGRYAEDGTLQGMLEVLKIPYLGSRIFASAVAMDKVVQRDFLVMAGIAITRGTVVRAYETDSDAIIARMKAQKIALPWLIKPAQEGSSLGITVIRSHAELWPALERARTIDQQVAQDVLVEEVIEGMEFSCIILEDYQNGTPLPLVPTEIVREAGTDIFDYAQKYMPGRALKFTPARCSADDCLRIQETCIQVMQALGIRTIARIDGFLCPDGRIVIIDPNTLSGMGPSTFLFRQAAEIGMGHAQVINHLVYTELAHTSNEILQGIMNKQCNARIDHGPKLRVAVLFGGPSNERETSLDSGRNVIYKLSPQKYSVIPIFIDSNMGLYHINERLLVRNSTKEIALGLTDDMRIGWSDLPAIADFVFIGLHGGEGENGAVQGALEMLGLPYNGSSVFTSALCMDKFKTNEFLRHKGFAVPAGRLVSLHQTESINWFDIFGCSSLIVKPHDDGCSVGVRNVINQEELRQALQELRLLGKEYALVEECVVGMELTVGVVGNGQPVAMPPSQAVAAAGVLSIEEKFLPGAGENQTPAPLSADALALVQRTVEAVYAAVGCTGYARIDCFYQTAEQSPTGHERVVIIEINTLPALTPATCIFHQAAELGIKPMEFIDQIVELGLQRHAVARDFHRQTTTEQCGLVNFVGKSSINHVHSE